MELHDSIGQTLAALKFRSEHIITTLENGETRETLRLLTESIPIFQRSIDETRAIYMGLKPTVLSEHGILSTLEWYRRELLKLYSSHHIELETQVAEEDIPDYLKITIFRIVQEALNNTFKHGEAEWIDIRLTANDGVMELEVSDDGVGMDLDRIMESLTAKSLGLLGMRERAELTGGEFTIISAPGEGTSIKTVWRNLSQISSLQQ
jgi:signal transduction histidine kinase